MSTAYRTVVEIAGAISESETARRVIASAIRERLATAGNPGRPATDRELAAAMTDAFHSEGRLVLTGWSRHAWHEILEATCRTFAVSYRVRGYAGDVLTREVAYTAHEGILHDKSAWDSQNARLNVGASCRVTLKEIKSDGLPPYA